MSAETANEGDASTSSCTTLEVRECINLASGEEEESTSPQSNVSTPKATQQRRRPRVHWTEEAKIVLMQQVYHEKPYLVAHGQRGKAWESVASAITTIPPFGDSGGIKAESRSIKYSAMIKEHRDNLHKSEWQSGKRDGENEDLYRLLQECMTEEQAVTQEKEKKLKDIRDKELEKDARAEELLQASMAPSGSRSRASGGTESTGGFENEAKSSSSSYSSSLESTMAGYFASLTDSPEAKRKREERELMEAKRKLDESDMLRRIVDSRQDSPDTKRRRKDAEESDAAARKMDSESRLLDAENRRLELQLKQEETKTRQEEAKARNAVQEGTLKLITNILDRFGGDT